MSNTDETDGGVFNTVLPRGRKIAPFVTEDNEEIDALHGRVEVGNWIRLLLYRQMANSNPSGEFTELEGEVLTVYEDPDSLGIPFGTRGVLKVAVNREVRWHDDQGRQSATIEHHSFDRVFLIKLSAPEVANAVMRLNPDRGTFTPYGQIVRAEADLEDTNGNEN